MYTYIYSGEDGGFCCRVDGKIDDDASEALSRRERDYIVKRVYYIVYSGCLGFK